MAEVLKDERSERAQRAMEALLAMKKLVIADQEAAYGAPLP